MLTRPLDAVFISDLHLHPDNSLITARFNQFIAWAAQNTKAVYILGDFLHAWPGDDALDSWSLAISQKLKWLAGLGVRLYFMHGNRDFLMGKAFINESSMTLLNEPTRIILQDIPILLVHGDRYCTQDKRHQWFRKLTRNVFFPKLFLRLPLSIRNKMVIGVRNLSQSNRYDPRTMNVVPEVLLKEMKEYGVNILIHGHTHKPGLTEHLNNGTLFKQYVLSDWDDSPQILCYHKSKGLYFVQLF